MIRRKILYLNVNGFLGKENKEENQKDIDKVREEISNGIITTYPKEVADKINSILENEKEYIVFLSEVDPYSWATDIFIKEMNKNYKEKYEVFPPYVNDLKKISGYSCTICLNKAQGYTNEGNGFNYKQNGKYDDRDFLECCKIVNLLNNIVLIGIHWNPGDDRKKRIIEFILSLSRLVISEISKGKKVIIFGDTNANPDVNFEKEIEEKNKDKIEAYMGNYIFEGLMEELGLHEIKPKKMSNTFGNPPQTRIDRVFTNMSNVEVEVESVFADEDLSDHAALLITYKED